MSLRFPFFVDLSGKKAVVVGGGTVGLRRARVLRDFGAAVTVVAPSLGAPLEGVAHIARRYQAGDLAEAFLAVAATDDRAVNRAVWEERIIEPAEGEREKYQEIFAVLGGTFTWPTEQKFEALEETVAGLKEPAMEDKIVLTAIQEGAKAYVSGKKTIDDAVNSVMQKLELYWME